MTQEQQDPISTAARLLREAAHELQLSHTIGGLGDWSDCEPEVIAAHGEYIAAAAGIERLAESLGAGGVEPLRARQCLHQIAEPGGWQPIETAPKDGQCLVWCDTDDGGEVMKLHRDARGNWIYEGEPTYCKSFYIQPTLWMPLPPSPSSAEGGSNADQA